MDQNNYFSTELDNSVITDPKVLSIHNNRELLYLKERIKNLESQSDKTAGYLADDTTVEKQVLELLNQFDELKEEKLDLETRFTTENTRFFELVEKLRDKLKLIALSTIEMEGKIRILNSKVPELEDVCHKQDKTIEDLVHKFRNASLDEIKNLEVGLRSTEENIKNLENEICKTMKKNKELDCEIDNITHESLEYHDRFENERRILQENITQLEKENADLEKKMEKISGINQETYNKKMQTLRREIDTLTTQIRRTKDEKIFLSEENETLKKEVKKLVLQKISNENSY